VAKEYNAAFGVNPMVAAMSLAAINVGLAVPAGISD
jgi:hypothetical protein